MWPVEPDNRKLSEPFEKQVWTLFRQLELDDPACQQYYRMLDRLNTMYPEPQPIWLRTSIHSAAPTMTF